MKIVDARVFQPGNIHSRYRLLEVTLSDAARLTVDPEAIGRLAHAFRRVKPQATDFAAWRRLHATTGPVPVAAAVEVLAVAIQRYVYWPVKFCAWRARPLRSGARRPANRAAEGRCLYEIRAELPGRAAADAALALVKDMIAGATSSALRKRFLVLMKRYVARTLKETPAGGTLAIVDAAGRRGIPWSLMHNSPFVRIGMGRHSQVLYHSETSNTASIGKTLAKDKGMTNKILATAGLPVAMQRIVRKESSLVESAREIGYPLVVKPYDGNMGRDITVGVEDDATLHQAFERARKSSTKVALERFIAGDEYRLLVIDGRLVAASHRRPAQVKGDGKSTVRQLVKKENRRPEREPILDGRLIAMKKISLDEDALAVLAGQGLTPDSVPPKKTVVYLRRVSNVSRGGEAVDVTDRIHPSIRDLAQRAAAAIRLDICGIDYITTDITKDWRTSGGRICEVNSRPGINMQIISSPVRAREITDAMLNSLFPDGAPSRAPVVALVGEPWQTIGIREAIEKAFADAGRLLGVVRTDPFHSACLQSSVQLEGFAAIECDDRCEGILIEATPDQVVTGGIGLEEVDLVLKSPTVAGDEGVYLEHALGRVARLGVEQLGATEAMAQALDVLGLYARQSDSHRHDTPVTDDDEFTALFVGDVGFGESYMHHPRVAELQSVLSQHGHRYSLAGLQGVLNLGDITIANLEVPLCARPDAALQHRKKYLGWCDAERTVDALRTARIGAVTLANNHALDGGPSGLSETLAHLKNAGITAFGAGSDADEAGRPFIHRFKIRGVAHSLVVFAGFEYRERYDRRYKWYARDTGGGVSQLDPDSIRSQIAALRASLPNPTFVAFPHWGTDYQDITTSQRDAATALVAAGVDLIIGHGAHVAQSIELIDGRPVLFNIGNFVWNTPGRFHKNNAQPLGLAVALTFDADQRLGPKLRIYPILTDNALTQFQNRPVNFAEFANAADLLKRDVDTRLRHNHDEIGYSLECRLGSHALTEAAKRLSVEHVNGHDAKARIGSLSRIGKRLKGVEAVAGARRTNSV